MHCYGATVGTGVGVALGSTSGVGVGVGATSGVGVGSIDTNRTNTI